MIDLLAGDRAHRQLRRAPADDRGHDPDLRGAAAGLALHLFDLADNLESVGHGEKLNTALAAKLAARISEIQLPRSALTT